MQYGYYEIELDFRDTSVEACNAQIVTSIKRVKGLMIRAPETTQKQ